MTEIKTLSEMPECCAVCWAGSFTPGPKAGVCLKHEKWISEAQWCEGFGAAHWVSNPHYTVNLTKPKLQEVEC